MKKYFDFIKNKKIFFGISIGLMAIGIVFNIIFGTQVSIQFTGGAIVKYSYTGSVDEESLKSVIQKATEKIVTTDISKSMISGSETYVASVAFAGDSTISLDQQKQLTEALEQNFPDNNFNQLESTSVNPSMGRTFFLKCLVAILMALLLMLIYVAFRFKNIGGWSAGVMAMVALVHDMLIIYFTFVVFKLPIDSNFIAVVLMILGYSLNDTIVIYDRIRENKKINPKSDVTTLVNDSINQTLDRTVNTSITTAAAIGCVLVIALVFNLPSIISFALPMFLGVISGCYSTISIAGPLWVMWRSRKHTKKTKTEKPKAENKVKNKK